MALIKLTASELENVHSQILRMSDKVNECANTVASVKNNLDMEVSAKRNIEDNLEVIKRDLNKHSEMLKSYANVLNDVVNEFVSADSNGKSSSVNWNPIAVQSSLAGLGITATLGHHTGEMYNWGLNQSLNKVNSTANLFGVSSAKTTEPSFLDKLWDKGKKAVDSIGDKAKEIYGNVVEAGKDCVSWVGEKVDDVKDWYNENEDAIKAYGTGALKVAAGSVAVVGSIVALIGTGGASVPLTMMSAIGGIDQIASGAADLIYAHNGQYDMVGETSALKEQVVSGAGEIGKALGDEETGKKAGEWIYTGYNAVNFIDGVDNMLNSMGKANTVLTGEYGSSSGWAWDWKKTSFDEIADTKIKFKIDTDYGVAPDYAIRKILGVDGSSDLNIIYEAGKNIYKSFEGAAKLGKEIGENADNLRF